MIRKPSPVRLLALWAALPALAGLALLGAGCTNDPCVVYTFRFARPSPTTGFVNFMESVGSKRISGHFADSSITAMAGTIVGNPTSCQTPPADQPKWTVDVWMSPKSVTDACDKNLNDTMCYPDAAYPRGTATFDWPTEGRKAVTVGLE